MNKISRIFLPGALALVLLLAACTGQEGSPTPVGTTGPGDETASPPPVGTETTSTPLGSPEATLETTSTANTTATIDTATLPAGTATTQTATTATADTTLTPGVPVTGADVVLLECQFCIEGMAHALLVLPDTATFEAVGATASLSTPGPDMGCHTVDSYNGRQVVLCRGEENTSMNLNICTRGGNCTQLLVELQSCPLTGTAQPEATGTALSGIPTSTAVVGATDTPPAGLPTAAP